MTKPASLIINTPFACPAQHWTEKKDGTLTLQDARRPAGYEIFDVRNNTRRTEELTLVNTIRVRVDQWREAGYPGVTIVTRRLLEHWFDQQARQHPFYFCQLEAIETLIWWIEGAEEYRQGIANPRRRRRMGAAVQQDGDRQRQDHGDGDDHHMAGAERADLPQAQQELRPRRVHRGARPDRQGAAARSLSGRARQLLRRLRSLPVRGAAPEA